MRSHEGYSGFGSERRTPGRIFVEPEYKGERFMGICRGKTPAFISAFITLQLSDPIVKRTELVLLTAERNPRKVMDAKLLIQKYQTVAHFNLLY